MAKKLNKKNIFVIQEHHASRLHYDFRLEINGTLKSWAVPKGISTDSSVKRLAVETEDHPLEYADFEGVIPDGSYGAGKVIIWDKGIFDNLKTNQTLAESYKQGGIEILLRGKKLRGCFALIKMKVKENQWLVFKMKK